MMKFELLKYSEGKSEDDGRAIRLVFSANNGKRGEDVLIEEDISDKIKAVTYTGFVPGEKDGTATIELTDEEFQYLHYLFFKKFSGFAGDTWGQFLRRFRTEFEQSNLKPLKRI